MNDNKMRLEVVTELESAIETNATDVKPIIKAQVMQILSKSVTDIKKK